MTTFLHAVRQDVRFALRTFARRRLMTAVALTTTALAIGAATSIYSLVDGVLFRSIAVPNEGRLMAVWQTIPAWRREPSLAPIWDHVVVSWPAFAHWRDAQQSFFAVGAATTGSRFLLSDAPPEQVGVTRASASLFATLGAVPVLGRTFLPGEDGMGGPHVALLSFDNWNTRFGGRSDVIGKTVRLDTLTYQIVGVLPKTFSLARGVPPSPFFVPAGQARDDIQSDNHSYRAIGRLKPGVTLEQASLEARRLLDITGDGRGTNLVEFQSDQVRTIRGPLLILLGAVGLLVVIACVNVATLLLGEATSREREMSARVALGATRGRLVRQLLTESVLLALAGGVLGAVLAGGMTKVLIAIAPRNIPGIATATIDLRVLMMALLATATTGVVFGVMPALVLSRQGAHALLHGAGQSGKGRGRLQAALVASQLALSVILLVGAGLLSRSLSKLTSVNPGFRTDRLLMVRTGAPAGTFATTIARRERDAAVLAQLSALPGAMAVSAASTLPFDGGSASSNVRPTVPATDDTTSHEAQQRAVAPSYFETIGIPLLAGRSFSAEDRSEGELVAIVSETLARLLWRDRSPIGQLIRYQRRDWRVVGIVADTKMSSLAGPDLGTIYVPAAQVDNDMKFLMRTRDDPMVVVPGVRAALHAVDPSIALLSAQTMEERIRLSFGEERFRTILIDLFGGLAGVLAIAGMYGVTARAASRRMREMGIRVALGATRTGIVRLILASTLGGVSIGLAAGLAGAIVAARLLTPYLFGIVAWDPLTYGSILLLVVLASIAASWLPARRAGDVNPMVVLRSE